VLLSEQPSEEQLAVGLQPPAVTQNS